MCLFQDPTKFCATWWDAAPLQPGEHPEKTVYCHLPQVVDVQYASVLSLKSPLRSAIRVNEGGRKKFSLQLSADEWADALLCATQAALPVILLNDDSEYQKSHAESCQAIEPGAGAALVSTSGCVAETTKALCSVQSEFSCNVRPRKLTKNHNVDGFSPCNHHATPQSPETCLRRIRARTLEAHTAVVGTKVEVYWPDESAWFRGVVSGSCSNFQAKGWHALIQYDDNQVHWEPVENLRLDFGWDRITLYSSCRSLVAIEVSRDSL
eukprot:SAG11_NODE_498_length_8940_cov_11.447121_4_plen_266_part_00